MKYVHTITEEDVGKPSMKYIKCFHCGITGVILFDFMGGVMPHDVGKRIYHDKSGICQVENDEQLAARLVREAKE